MHQSFRGMFRDIDRCLRRDQQVMRRQLRTLQKRFKSDKDIALSLADLGKRIEGSIQSREHRISDVPEIRFPKLPVADKRVDIEQAISNHQVVIICGETGSGKTTQLPKMCLSIGRGSAGFIGHTQPRRIAARSVAVRIAEELGEELGHTVGYKIRFHDTTKPEALIKVMTDGILLAETRSDPYFDQYDTLIIDEAHERSLNIDFLLGYLKWLLPKRPDLKVIITSATFDPQKFSSHFGDAPIIEVSGRTYPVDVRYKDLRADGEPEKDLQQAILDAVDELICERQGDILVFLSGERDIRETAEALRKHPLEHCEILPLYSRLSGSEQIRIFKAHNKLRIILSTNVAETSLTVPGIHCVIDSGYARISRYNPRSKLQRLAIEKISKASANQRAGRCGRLGPGVCIRLYSEDDFETRVEYTDPEILRTNLASVILTMKALSLGDIQGFPFIDPPDRRLIRDGVKLLQELSAIVDDGNLTPLGRKLSRFPIDPRLGRMLLAAETENCLAEMEIITAALSIQDPRERPLERAQAADQCHARFQHDKSDFLSYLKIWNHYQEQKQHLSNNKLRKYCREQFLSYVRVRQWQDIQQQLKHLIKGELQMKSNQQPAGYDQIHRALLSGLLGNIGVKQDSSEYLGARNQKFFIHPGSGQFRVKPKWLVCSERVETTKVYARNVAKIDPSWIEAVAPPPLLKRNYYEPHWERKPARVMVYEQLILYGLVLANRRKVPYERIDPVAAREIFIRSALVNHDYQTNAKFFRQNQELLESRNYLHHKGRRMDLMVDEELIYQFFDQCIPASVVNGITFDRWRKPIEEKQPDYLCLTVEALSGNKAPHLDDNEFPDEFELGDTKLKLEYHFEPGHEQDGVTAIVPLHQLNQLEPEPFEWIVPGLLREKIIALIKALPKSIRRNFVPISEYADQCFHELERNTTSLYGSLAVLLTKMSGTLVNHNIWKDSSIENYLKVYYRIVDENGNEMDSGRDLLALKQKYGEQAGENFRQLAWKHQDQHSGCAAWDFGDLPKQVEIKHNEQWVIGYPSLIDEGIAIGVRTFDTEAEAGNYHRNGLIRMFQLSLRKEIIYLKKNTKVDADIFLTHNQIASHPFLYTDCKKLELPEQLVMATLGKVFVDGQNDIRCRQDFEQRLQDNKRGLLATADTVNELLVEVLREYREIRKNLDHIPVGSLTKDITEQLGLMLYNGFLIHTPYHILIEFPRYLKAIQYRMEKGRENSQRDLSKLNELLPLWRQYWESVMADTGSKAVRPENDHFRWSLEEFRVSLFAQTLKTAFPVSAKRLQKAWHQRTAA